MRILLLLLPLLYACQPNEPVPAQEVQSVGVLLRYQATEQLLSGRVIFQDSSYYVPLIESQPMQSTAGMPALRFEVEQRIVLPGQLHVDIPEDGDTASFVFTIDSVYLDSLPAIIYQDTTVTFEVAREGLAENESLVVAFEPSGRGSIERILLAGPSRNGSITLPAATLEDFPPGEYTVYLIKQQNFRDRQGYVRASLQTEYRSRSAPLTIK